MKLNFSINLTLKYKIIKYFMIIHEVKTFYNK
jgi:hypothetical protein